MDKKGLLPSCWGPMAWGMINSVAFVYNPQRDKQNYFDFFMKLGSVLPCDECRTHYYQNINKQELLAALESNETFFRWVYDLHNKVNQQIGVPESKWPSYESVKERYESYKASCDTLPGACGTGVGIIPKKKIKVVEQFGNFNEDQIPWVISTFIFLFVIICMGSLMIFRPKGKIPGVRKNSPT